MRGSSRRRLAIALAVLGVVQDGVDVVEDVPLGDGGIAVAGAKLFERRRDICLGKGQFTTEGKGLRGEVSGAAIAC